MPIFKTYDAHSAEKIAELTLEQLATHNYANMKPLWELCEDVFAGESVIKNKAYKYIYRPRSKSEGKDAENAWRAYRKRGKLPAFASKTLEQMQGILGAIPPQITLDGKGERLASLREYATPYRDGLEALTNRVRENILRTGRYCLLLEPDKEGDKFHINEYKCWDFLRCVITDKGEETFAKCIFLNTSKIEYNTKVWRDVYYPEITLLALDSQERYYQAKFGGVGIRMEGIDNAGKYKWSDTEEYGNTMGRLFAMLESFDVENPDAGKCDSLVYPVKYGKTFDRIPFVSFNPTNLSLMSYQNPPMLNLCLQCLHILEADCDHQNAIFMTTDPTAVISGANKKDLATGADAVVFLPQGGSFGYVAAGSEGIPQQMQNIENMKADALQMGVSLAGQEGAVNSSGVALSIVRNAQTAALRMINDNVGKGMELILHFAGKWLGMSQEECAENIKFVPSNDFAELKASPQEIVALMNATLPMTEEEKRRYLEKNGIVDPVPWEELKEKLDEEKEQAHDHGIESVAGAFGFGKDEEEQEEKKPEEEEKPEAE